MALNITVTVDQSEIDRVNNALKSIKNGANKALTRSLNFVLKKARVSASTEIREDVNLTKKYVDKKLKTSFATSSDLKAVLSAEKRGTLLTRFPHKKLKSGGYSVKVKKSGKTIKMRSGIFVPNLKNSGATGLALPFKIAQERKKGPVKQSSGIYVLHGPSVSQVMVAVKDKIMPDMDNVLATEMDRQIGVILQQFGGSA